MIICIKIYVYQPKEEKGRKLERLVGWGEGSSHLEDEEEGWTAGQRFQDLRMESKPAEKVRKQTKLITTWSILPKEMEMETQSSHVEKIPPGQVGSEDDPLPTRSSLEQSPKTINASGKSKEERSINMRAIL